MKNLKTMMATLVLVTMLSVSSTFGGVYIIDRNGSEVKNDTPTNCGEPANGNGGVILGGVILGGVILGGVILGGVILGGTGSTADMPCTNIDHD